MNELMQLKMEARKLLEEINQNYERSPNGSIIYLSGQSNNSIEENSIKERVALLRQKMLTLRSKNKYSM